MEWIGKGFVLSRGYCGDMCIYVRVCVGRLVGEWVCDREDYVHTYTRAGAVVEVEEGDGEEGGEKGEKGERGEREERGE